MNRKKIASLHIKVSSFFLLLVLLVSVFPAVTSAGIETYREISAGGLKNTYLLVMFQYAYPPAKNISDLRPGDFAIFGSLTVYRNVTDSKNQNHPPLFGEVANLLKSNGISSDIYGLYYLGNENFVFVPLTKRPYDADCYVAESANKEGPTTYMLRIDGHWAVYHNSTIESVKILHPKSEEERVLSAALLESPEYCIMGGNFYQDFINTIDSWGGVRHLSMEEFFLVIPGKVDVNGLYKKMYEKFAPRGWYPEIRVVTPEWILANEDRGKPLWNYIWEYVVLLLPLIPAILLILGREKKDEEKMKELISTYGGNALFLELITAGIVLGGATLSSLYFGAKYGFVVSLILAIFLFLRNFIAGSKREVIKPALVALFFLMFLPALLSHIRLKFRYYLGLWFATPFLVSGDINLYWGSVIFATHYIPYLLLAIGLGSMLSLIFELMNRPSLKAAKRTLAPSLLSLLVLTTYAGFVLSLPVGSLYSQVTDGSYGATISVYFPNSGEDPVRVWKAYNTTVELLRQEKAQFATLWSAGKIYQGEGLGWIVVGELECYDDDLIEFLKEGTYQSFSASRMYRILDNKDKILMDPSLAEKLGTLNDGKVKIKLYLLDKTYEIKSNAIKLHQLPKGLAYAHCTLIRSQGSNITFLPRIVYIRGDRSLLTRLKANLSTYGDNVELWSIEGPANYFMESLADPKGALPFAVSGFLMPLTALILGMRDRERLGRLNSIITTWGGKDGRIYLPLTAILPGLLLQGVIIKDGLRFYSLGFVPLQKFLVLFLPATGAGLALVVYMVAVMTGKGR